MIEQHQANRRPFLQKQLELCFEATDVAARLASETNPTKWEEARLTFWRLYWGTLSIVENDVVAAAMVNLGKIVPNEPVSSPKLLFDSLQHPSYKLAQAARDWMEFNWHVELPPIPKQR